jgi:hypothetical protein
MANVLMVGLLSRHRRRGGRSFLLGFEAFGMTALALFIAGASIFTAELRPYLDLVHTLLGKTFGPSLRDHDIIVYLIFAVVLGLPQLTFALIGGLWFRKLLTPRAQEWNSSGS